ncbi:MAG: transcriptional regulator [Phycisphaerae bacterium]|nr:transcriptional regulator [Phycisphaerae bacterium]
MCTACGFHAPVDNDFAGRLLGIVNNGALSLMISIGHRTGLFDTLASMGGPATLERIVEASGLNDRYVREWLGAMVAGRVVLVDEDDRYWLPDEHASSLTRANPAGNMGVFAQYVAVLADVEDEVVNCFKNGGGVPYRRFRRFHEVMAEDSGQSTVSNLVSAILPLVPEAFARMESGIDVLDVGCGSGRALIRMAREFPRSRFVGLDISAEALAVATRLADEEGLTNVWFERRDASEMNDQGRYDLITTFDAVHDQAQPAKVLANIRRALRDGGTYLMQDIQGTGSHAGDAAHPMAQFIYTVSCMHCMTVSLSAGGAGLGAAWGRPLAERMLREAGFERIDVRELEHDPQNFYYLARAA